MSSSNHPPELPEWFYKELVKLKTDLVRVETENIDVKSVENLKEKVAVLEQAFKDSELLKNTKDSKQDARISDISTMVSKNSNLIGIFGGLIGIFSITVTVSTIYFSIAARDLAIAEAKNETEKWMLENSSRIESVLITKVDHVLLDISDRISIKEHVFNKEINDMIDKASSDLKSLIDSTRKDVNFLMEQYESLPLMRDDGKILGDGNETAISIAKGKGVEERDYFDWYIIAQDYKFRGEYERALESYRVALSYSLKSGADKYVVKKIQTLIRDVEIDLDYEFDIDLFYKDIINVFKDDDSFDGVSVYCPALYTLSKYHLRSSEYDSMIGVYDQIIKNCAVNDEDGIHYSTAYSLLYESFDNRDYETFMFYSDLVEGIYLNGIEDYYELFLMSKYLKTSAAVEFSIDNKYSEEFSDVLDESKVNDYSKVVSDFLMDIINKSIYIQNDKYSYFYYKKMEDFARSVVGDDYVDVKLMRARYNLAVSYYNMKDNSEYIYLLDKNINYYLSISGELSDDLKEVILRSLAFKYKIFEVYGAREKLQELDDLAFKITENFSFFKNKDVVFYER